MSSIMPDFLGAISLMYGSFSANFAGKSKKNCTEFAKIARWREQRRREIGGSGPLLGHDANGSADFHELKQGEHILRGEADAAVGGWRAEELRFVGAVDVDVAGAGVGVVRIQPVERQNTGQNGILTACRFS